MSLVKKKIIAKFFFALVQSIFASSAIILAVLMHFNFLSIHLFLEIPEESLNFYIAMFLLFGFVFLIGGLFLFYEWWENR